MRNIFVAGAALALVSTSALAQGTPNVPAGQSLEQQEQQAQLRHLAAQSDYYLAVAKRLQADAAEGAKRAAAVDAWWANWWAAMYPDAPSPAAK